MFFFFSHPFPPTPHPNRDFFMYLLPSHPRKQDALSAFSIPLPQPQQSTSCSTASSRWWSTPRATLPMSRMTSSHWSASCSCKSRPWRRSRPTIGKSVTRQGMPSFLLCAPPTAWVCNSTPPTALPKHAMRNHGDAVLALCGPYPFH